MVASSATSTVVKSVDGLKTVALKTLKDTFHKLPGRTDDDRIRFCVDVIMVQVETLDDLIPALSELFDIPVVDDMQRALVDVLVRQVYNLLIADRGEEDSGLQKQQPSRLGAPAEDDDDSEPLSLD